MYGEASVEANLAMQEPLERLYQYENQPDMREKIKEYIGELDVEYDRLEGEWVKRLGDKDEDRITIEFRSVMRTLMLVKNDLQGRLEDMIQMDELRIKIEQLIEDLENETVNRHMNDLEQGKYDGYRDILDLLDEME